MDARENAKILDPKRFAIAKSNAVMPGGPQNNNPMNVTGIQDAPVQADSIYGDHRQAYGQMGAGIINPNGVQNSGLPQFHPLGRGYNSEAPFNMQQQPPAEMEEQLEGGRLSFEGKQKGLYTEPYLGISGQPATPAPGGVDVGTQQSPHTIPLMGNNTASIPPAGGMNTTTGKRG